MSIICTTIVISDYKLTKFRLNLEVYGEKMTQYTIKAAVKYSHIAPVKIIQSCQSGFTRCGISESLPNC